MCASRQISVKQEEQMQSLDQDTRGIAREIALIAGMVAVAIVVALAAPAYAEDEQSVINSLDSGQSGVPEVEEQIQRALAKARAAGIAALRR